MADQGLDNKEVSEETKKVADFFKIGNIAADDTTKNNPAEPAKPIEAKVEEKPIEAKVEPTAPVKEDIAPKLETKAQPKEYSTEELLEMLKAKGHEFEPPVKKSKEELASERQDSKMAWAFANNKISSKEYNAFVSESSDLTSLVYREYLRLQKEEDSTLSDTEILEDFNQKFGQGFDVDKTSREYKSGSKLIQSIGNQLLKDKYAKIFDLETGFTAYEATENNRKSEEKKILSESPKYKNNVEEIFTKDLTAFTVKTSEGDWSLEVPADILASVKSQFLDKEVAMSHIKEGKDKESLTATAKLLLLEASLPSLIENSQKQYFLKHQKGVKGVPETNFVHTEPKEVSEATKKVASFFNIQEQIAN